MRKEAVKVTPGDIIAPGQSPTPERGEGTAGPKAQGKGGTARSRPKAGTSAAVATPRKPAGRGAAGGGETAVAVRPEPPPTAGAPAEEAAAVAPDPAATRRNFFRLDVFDVSVRFELESVAGKAPQPVTIRGNLGDVSAGGLRLVADGDAGPMPDWPVQADILGRLQFGLLEDEPGFDLPGRLVRRVETTAGFELAFSWNEPPQPEIDRLVHDLYQLEVRRRAAIPDDRRVKKAQRGPARESAGRRQPMLLGAALGLAAAIAVYETVAMPAVPPVLGVAAVLLAAAYLLVGG